MIELGTEELHHSANGIEDIFLLVSVCGSPCTLLSLEFENFGFSQELIARQGCFRRSWHWMSNVWQSQECYNECYKHSKTIKNVGSLHSAFDGTKYICIVSCVSLDPCHGVADN